MEKFFVFKRENAESPTETETYEHVIDVVKCAETVEAAPVIRARWKGPDEPPHIKGTVCTNCGGLTLDMGNFCGNCGARMDLA